MATNIGDTATHKSFLESVQRDSSQRLAAEVRRATDVFPQEAISKWSRRELINVVVALRKHAGSHTAVKAFLPDFSITEVPVLLPEPSDMDERPQTPGSQTVAPTIDFAALLATLQQQSVIQQQAMQQQQQALQEQLFALNERALNAEAKARQERAEAEAKARQERANAEARAQQQQENMQAILRLLADKQIAELDLSNKQLKLAEKANAEREAEDAKFENRLAKATKVMLCRQMTILSTSSATYRTSIQLWTETLSIMTCV